MRQRYGTGSITQRKDGRFEVRRIVVDRDGNRKRKGLGTVGTIAEAKRLLREAPETFYLPEKRKRDNDAKDTVASFIARWLEKSVKPGRASTYTLYQGGRYSGQSWSLSSFNLLVQSQSTISSANLQTNAGLRSGSYGESYSWGGVLIYDFLRLHSGKETHVVRETMTEMAGKLPPDTFMRIHRSIIVNVERVREVQPWFKGDYVLIMHDGTKLRSGRSYRQSVQALIG